ncbi:growth and transformation-dependent protein [Anopheles darlingi]|uniref:Growth and transformation-dependent protein n=1 Tax=Anopheles darlingi TaxID=43151 RepID=W5JSC6_ANODA|nr:LOW QUALITY PROTEIN: UPF0389 protein CG9231 [Anopheles darlingi]ETN67021.1 growth and transformation-dependent protein [Anopheles darlingi]
MHYLRTFACGFARTTVSSAGLSSRSATARSFCSQIEPKPTPKPTATGNGSTISAHTHAPNNLEKRMLVFTKRYKSIDEVPNFVSQEKMERVRNQVRIKVANYMMIATAIGCIIMVISGKKAQERGETVSQMNLDWHKEYNEKAQAEYEAAQAAQAKK